MSHLTPATKASKGQGHETPRAPFAGPRGIVRRPPNCGIAFIDRAAAEDGPIQLMPPGRCSLLRASDHAVIQRQAPLASPNRTGLPDQVRAGIESLSGFDMSDVRVHYNSSKPAQLHALAYTQGTDIHVAPGQEQHLPHEAWHVVQQAQGRVLPTMQLKGGVPVNDDQRLEQEAEVMGEKALQLRRPDSSTVGVNPQTAWIANAVGLRDGKGTSLNAARLQNVPAQMMKIKSVHPKTKKDKFTDLRAGTRKTFQERYKIETGQTITLSDPQIAVYDTLSEQQVEFADINEFLAELNRLLQDWGGQKFFYETPGNAVDGGKIIKKRTDLLGQSPSTDVKLYSSRSAADVQSLFNWAIANGITTTNFNGFVAGAAVDAPLKGHFGDRIHTFKHYGQKRAQGARIICLHLNASGSDEIRGVRDDPNFISQGGEGSSVGGFGLKSENKFVSVALGKSKGTWDHMKGKIASVELVR